VRITASEALQEYSTALEVVEFLCAQRIDPKRDPKDSKQAANRGQDRAECAQDDVFSDLSKEIQVKCLANRAASYLCLLRFSEALADVQVENVVEFPKGQLGRWNAL
jgi:hypothetical protein